MIDWLSNWLKDIILIILLASFIEMLLPSSKMQKYIKMVLSLLIILTIVNPLLSIFSNDLEIRRFINGLDNNINFTEDYSSINQTDYSKTYEDKLLNQVEANMLIEAKNLLEKKYSITVNDINLIAELKEEGWKINQLLIFITELEEIDLSEKNEFNKIETIDEVQQVNISVIAKKNSTKSEVIESTNEIEKEIKVLIHEEWGIEKGIIFVVLQ